jgi:hypothetical protein
MVEMKAMEARRALLDRGAAAAAAGGAESVRRTLGELAAKGGGHQEELELARAHGAWHIAHGA